MRIHIHKTNFRIVFLVDKRIKYLSLAKQENIY